MHPQSRVAEVLRLSEAGNTSTEIALTTGLPRSTVRAWRSGALPHSHNPRKGCTTCGGDPHNFSGLGSSYSYLLGLYLGDGSIASHPRGVYKLRITLDARYPRIIDECASAIAAVMPRNKVNTWPRRYGDVEVYSYSKAWPCLLPQHGRGPKHFRPIRLVSWQQAITDRSPEPFVRGLIHSDGCRFQNSGRNWSHPRYRFDNLSSDIRAIFCEACDRLGLHWTKSGRTIYVSRKADVARLDGFVGPKA